MLFAHLEHHSHPLVSCNKGWLLALVIIEAPQPHGVHIGRGNRYHPHLNIHLQGKSGCNNSLVTNILLQHLMML
jgi:hypothetical protein